MGRLLLLVCAALAAAHTNADPFAGARRKMVELVRQDFTATAAMLEQRELDARVASAMATVARHEFVAPDLHKHAYENRPLPIGFGQTISQPYIVAAMTQLLQLARGERALEVGTGSGYQAAILAELGVRVFTMEIIEPLGVAARERLTRLGYQGIETRIGDGYYGWPERAPFDAIIVTAASNHIPPPLLEQLKPGGRMVIPVGNPFSSQQLVVVTKDAQGRITTRRMLAVRFVPLTGSHDRR
jgi:protein-L-isoaspartate(D-aspartate) O-methyltransferase